MKVNLVMTKLNKKFLDTNMLVALANKVVYEKIQSSL